VRLPASAYPTPAFIDGVVYGDSKSDPPGAGMGGRIGMSGFLRPLLER
jgi:hypothetical protein